MSLYNYFKKQPPVQRGVFVPSTAGTCPKLSAADVASCNSQVESTEKKEKTKVTYHKYTPAQRADIGKYAAHHGGSAACKHFKALLGHDLPEPTARKFKNAYVNELERRKREVPTDQCIAPVDELPPRKRGRPLLLGEYDELVQNYIKCL